MPELRRPDLFKTAGLIEGAAVLASHSRPAAARGIEVQATTVFERFDDGGRTWGDIEVIASDPPRRVAGHRWSTRIRAGSW